MCAVNSSNENTLSGYALFSVMFGCRERPKNGCQVREIVISPSIELIILSWYFSLLVTCLLPSEETGAKIRVCLTNCLSHNIHRFS